MRSTHVMIGFFVIVGVVTILFGQGDGARIPVQSGGVLVFVRCSGSTRCASCGIVL